VAFAPVQLAIGVQSRGQFANLRAGLQNLPREQECHYDSSHYEREAAPKDRLRYCQICQFLAPITHRSREEALLVRAELTDSNIAFAQWWLRSLIARMQRDNL
jgi:hypothetical protein